MSSKVLAVTQKRVSQSDSARLDSESPASTQSEHGGLPTVSLWRDVPLVIGIIIYVVSQTAFQYLTKVQDEMRIPKCDGCEPEPFKAPLMQGFIGNLSELIGLPVYIFFEAYFFYSRKKKHGSSIMWKRFEQFLGMGDSRPQPGSDVWCEEQERKRSCQDCRIWDQQVFFGFVLRTGMLDPVGCAGRASPEDPATESLLRESPPKPRVPFYYWFLPGWIGLLGSVSRNMSYMVMPISISTMISGLLIPVVAVLSWWLLKKRLYFAPHGLGITLVFFGVVCISMIGFLGTDIGGGSSQYFTGVLLVVVQVVLYAINNVWHEYLLNNYDANPLEVISIDSLGSALLMLVLLLPLFQAIGVEDVTGSLYQITHDTHMLSITGIITFAHFPAQLMQYFIIGRSSALLYIMVQQAQGLVLWLVELGMGGVDFQVLQLVGYIAIVLGTMFYSYAIPIRRWLNLSPSLEEIVTEEEAELKGAIYERYLEGDGNSWLKLSFFINCVRCPCQKRRLSPSHSSRQYMTQSFGRPSPSDSDSSEDSTMSRISTGSATGLIES